MFNYPAIFNPNNAHPYRHLVGKVLDPTFDVFDNFFEDFGRHFGSAVYQDEDGNGVYELEVPGFNKDNLKCELSNGVLTIQGSREVKDKNYAGKSQILKRLEVGGEAQDVAAEVRDGILKVVVTYTKPVPGKVVEVK